ncbi:Uncharacterised protein [Legionella birminghamensis]|uniref:Uncharacterized protein n=1 Tax=Legionella birminghamensis TaxID=28083 RepID=A0A378IEJ6_9GAMM|nr:Uncharacterised protein [Legionella birminghamensis]
MNQFTDTFIKRLKSEQLDLIIIKYTQVLVTFYQPNKEEIANKLNNIFC